MNTIKRNKKIFEYIIVNLNRLDNTITINDFFKSFVIENLDVKNTLLVASVENIEPSILDDDNILFETLKAIGIMEVSNTIKELQKLNEKKKKLKSKSNKLTDFDKILKGIMRIPNKESK